MFFVNKNDYIVTFFSFFVMEREVPESLVPYTKFIKFEKADEMATQQGIEKIDTFVKGHSLAINHVRRKAAQKTYYPTDDYMNQYHDLLTVLNYFTKEDDNIILKYQVVSLENMIVIANEMKSFLVKYGDVYVDCDQFLAALDDNARDDPEYKIVKRRRCALHKKSKLIYRKICIPDYKELIRTEIVAANNRYIPEFQYSPPSQFDDIIGEFIIHSKLSNIIYPTAKMIASGMPDSAVYTLSEFCNDVYSLLNLTSQQSKAVVYTSVVRFLFNQAYAIDSELAHYRKANAVFLLKAEQFSKQPVRDLKLTKDISRYYTPGLPVSTLFKSKQLDMLKQMEIMTNPIDLMKHVHTIILSLASYFGSESGMLSFDDTLTLLLALMSLSPPSNAVSITKFVEKWQNVQLDDIVGKSKDFFIAAVETLLTEEEMKMVD